MSRKRGRRSVETPVEVPASALEESPAAPVDSNRPQPRWKRHAVLGGFVIAWLWLSGVSGFQRGATFDEPLHLVAGYAALRGEHRIDPSHPPLVRAWAALPLYVGEHPTIDTSTIDAVTGAAWLASPGETTMAREFLFGHADADAVLRRSRSMIMLLGVGLGLMLFLWTEQWLGFRAAAFTLGFYVITPSLLGHGALVTTDFGTAVFVFGAVYFLWRTTRSPSPGNVAGLAAMVAAVTLTKYSGLAVLPVLGVLLAAAIWSRAGITVKQGAGAAAVAATATLLAIWAAYGFRYAPSPNATWLFRLHEQPTFALLAPGLSQAVALIDAWHIVPNAYSQGLLFGLASASQNAYLLGEYSREGWWYYFPIAFLVKTPVSLIVLLGVGVVVMTRRWRKLGWLNCLFVALPIAAYGALAMASDVNIGIRHLLPVYPFILILAGEAADRWVAIPSRVARAAFGAVLLVWVLSVAMVYPSTLTFFNVAAGGPRAGLRYLADSNIDWGQHLPALKDWMERTGVTHVNLAYFGQADPEYYGINATYLPSTPWLMPRVTSPPELPGFVAISATVLSGVYLPPEWRVFYEGFRGREPIANIGNSIRVYWVNAWPEAAGASLEQQLALAGGLKERLRWPEHAALHYQAALDALEDLVAMNERDPSARISLVLALMDQGRPADALPHSLAAIELLPGEAAVWRLHGRTLELNGRFAEAVTSFEHALDLDPSSNDTREDLKRVRSRLR